MTLFNVQLFSHLFIFLHILCLSGVGSETHLFDPCLNLLVSWMLFLFILTNDISLQARMFLHTHL